MGIYKNLTIFLCLAATASAFVNGNPAQPALICQSLVRSSNDKFAIRMAFLDDYVYAQHFKLEFPDPLNPERPPLAKLSTEAGVLTLNFQKRLDIYGIFGSSRLQMDREIFARRQFAWGVGAKTIIFQMDCFRIGCDFKYFTTTQTPLYFISSAIPLDVVSDLDLKYRDYQASLGAAYQSDLFCPYILGTYINSKISPSMQRFLIAMPGGDIGEGEFHAFRGANQWGVAVGATLVMGEKGILSVESRFINQNAIDASLEIRF